jgi:hypothetical protein
MPYTNAAKNAMLDRHVGKTNTLVVTHLSLHTADPTTTGNNEVTGGSYARVSVSASDFAVAGNSIQGAILLSADKQFAGPASGTATFFGTWGAGPTFLGGGTITGDTAFNAAGEFILKAGTAMNLNA